jgi:dipeptidyl aminopeptidase/acylaminoacyl peptidase
VVAFHRESGPLEVWAGVPDDLRRLSDHHRALEGVALGNVEDFFFEAPDGSRLDGILVRPTGASDAGPWPTVVVPHGGPYNRSGRELHVRPGDWAQWLASGGYAVLMPNYRGGIGRGQVFAAQVRGDMGGAEWLDVLAAVDTAVERGIADPNRLGIGGWSQGGFLSAWAVTQTRRFKAAVVGGGPTDWTMLSATSDLPSFESALTGGAAWDATTRRLADGRSPLVHAGSITTPLLILHGQEDKRVPLHQAVALHRALRNRGVPVELVTYPREPHAVHERRHQADILRRVRAWYDRWLLAEEGG